MPLDPAVAGIISFIAQQRRPSLDQLTVEQIRSNTDMTRALQKPPQEVASVVDAAYGSAPEQALRIYTPSSGSAPYPVLVHYHGGGFVTGGLAIIDEPSRALANDLGALVVAATYRKGPEWKFPAAHEDAWSALQWVAENIAEHGADLDRLAVVGDSAGGNLAASVASRARAAGAPALRAMALLYPLVSPELDTPSRKEYVQGYLIDGEAARYYMTQYAGSPQDNLDPRMALDRTPSFEGLPPTLVLTNEYDMVRDEGEQFARDLAAAGVDVTTQRFDGLVHVVYWMSAAVPRQAEIHGAVVDFLRKHLS